MQVTEEKTEKNRQVTKSRYAHRGTMRNARRVQRCRRQNQLRREMLLRSRMKAPEAVRLQEFRETMVRRAEQEHRETIVQEKEGREETTPVSRIRTALQEAEREETAVLQETERAQDVV